MRQSTYHPQRSGFHGKSGNSVVQARSEFQTSTRTMVLFCLPLILVLLGLAQARAADNIRILAFGDSLSAGYQLPQGQGFTDQLQEHLARKGMMVEIINAAVSGDTTATGLSRQDWSTPDKVDLVLLELGANDALQGLPVEKAKANLAAIIKRFQEQNIEVLLMGMRAPPNMGKAYEEAFNAIYPELASEYDVTLYPFFLDGVAADPALNLSDGIHPNAEGIAIIVKRIAPVVTDIVKTLN